MRAPSTSSDSHEPQPAGRPPSRVTLWAAVTLAVLAGGVFLLRGPWFAMRHGGSDFALLYSLGGAWLAGDNPYDPQAAGEAWTRGGGAPGTSPAVRGGQTLLYPPPALPAFSLFALAPASVSLLAWTVLNSLLLAATAIALARLARFDIHRPAFWLLMAATGLFTPAQTAVRHGQTPVIAFGLVAVGSWLCCSARRHSGGGAHSGGGSGGGGGVLIGLGVAIKPQLALPYLMLDLWRRRGRRVLAAVAVLAGLTVLGVAVLHFTTPSWLGDLTRNLQLFQHDSAGDPTWINASRHQMLNLHVLLHSFTDNRQLVGVLVYAIVATLAAVFFFGVDLRRRDDDRELLAVSVVGVLTLLVAYHRYYDAVLLLPAAAYAMRLALAGRWRLAAVLGVLLLPFYLNLTTVLAVLANSGRLPADVMQAPLWRIFVTPLLGWSLLGLAAAMTVGNWPKREAQT